jgi:uncharacterized membrane protein YraQ (UPF0718 family)
MTRERKFTILILIGTLIVGVLIGLLVPGLFHKYRSGKQSSRAGADRAEISKQEWFSNAIKRVVKPDSVQAKRIKPITDWAAHQVDSIERSSNAQMSELLDSVKVQLKPILNEEQQKRLDEFQGRARGQWGGKGGRNGKSVRQTQSGNDPTRSK